MLKKLKRIIITAAGFSVVFLGILLIFLPGPAFIIIPLGLGILALEYDWAKKIFSKIKNKKRDGQNL